MICKGKSKSSEAGQEDSDLTPKQRRRAQVRKAQMFVTLLSSRPLNALSLP